MASAGTVSVAFKATGLGKFKTECDRAAQATEQLGNQTKRATDEFKSFGSAAAKAGKLGAGLAAAGAAMGVGIGKAAGAAGEFDMTMTKVGLVSGATTKQLKILKAEALRLGQATQFSPDQAAQGFLTLAQSGKDYKEQMQLMEPVLGLASAGQISVAESAALATRSMMAFGLKSDQIANANDKLLKITQKVDINMNQIASTFGKTAGKMGAYGQEFDTVAMTLGIATAATGDAAVASASLATATAAVQKKQKALKDQLGVDVFDAQTGAARQLDAVMLDMADALDKLEPKQRSQILINTLGQRGILAYTAVTKAGRKSVDEMRDAMDKSSGTTKKFSDAILATFSGKVILMVGSFQTLIIAIGDSLKNVLAPGISAVTFILNALITGIQMIPGPAKTALSVLAVGFAGLTAAIGTALVAAASFAATSKAVTAALAGTTIGAKLAEVGFMGLGRAALMAMLPALAVIAKLGFILGVVALVIGRFAAEGEAAFFHLRDSVGTMVAHIQFFFSNMMKFITGIIQSGLGFIGKAFKFVFGGILSIVKAVFNGIVAGMAGAINLVSKGVGSIVDTYGELLFALGQEQEAAALRGVIKDLKNFDASPAFDDAIAGSAQALGQIGTAVKGWASYTGKITGEVISGIGMQWKSNAVGMGKTVKSELSKSVEGLMSLLGKATEDMDELGKSTKETGKQFKGLGGDLKLGPLGGGAGAGAGGGGGGAGAGAGASIRTRPAEDFGGYANALDQMRGQRADRQQGAISAAQSMASGNVGGMVGGIATAMGSALGPVAGAAMGLVDSLMGASEGGKEFKEGLSKVFGAFAQALSPVFKALMPLLDLFDPLLDIVEPIAQLAAIFMEILMATSLLQPALFILGKVAGAIAWVLNRLQFVMRQFYIEVLKIIQMLPGLDFSAQITQLENAQRATNAEAEAIERRLRGEETRAQQRARREQELAQATREATSAMLNVPSAYKVARAGFRAETPVMDDFIQRPGQPATQFSAQDTVIGVKDTGSLGGPTIVIQNLDIRANNPTQFFRRLMSMVDRDERAGGVSLGGSFQGRP
jgi:TP901 family phage tail tape measure protein